MASPQQSTERLSELDLRKVPHRLTDAMIAKLEDIAACHIPEPQPIRPAKFIEFMAVLDANLVRRQGDDISGEIRVRTWRDMLGHLPAEVIAIIQREVLAYHQFVPTIAECLAIAERYAGKNLLRDKRDEVLRRIAAEKHARYWDLQEAFKAMMTRLSREPVPQDEIDAMRPDWISQAEGYGYLRKSDDGTGYVQRGVPAA